MRLLLAYSPTAEGRAALEAARLEALLREASVLLVRHVKPATQSAAQAAAQTAPLPQGEVVRGTATNPTTGPNTSKLREELDAVGEELRAAGIDCEALLLTRPSDPSDALLQLARDEGVDLIVMGLRRRSPVGKLVMGSVAQDILLKAECPVLAVKAPPQA